MSEKMLHGKVRWFSSAAMLGSALSQLSCNCWPARGRSHRRRQRRGRWAGKWPRLGRRNRPRCPRFGCWRSTAWRQGRHRPLMCRATTNPGSQSRTQGLIGAWRPPVPVTATSVSLWVVRAQSPAWGRPDDEPFSKSRPRLRRCSSPPVGRRLGPRCKARRPWWHRRRRGHSGR